MAPSQPKHPYNPGWSWGNVIAAVGIVVSVTASGLGVYVLLRVDSARAAERVITLDGKIDDVKEQSEARFSKIETKVEDLSTKAEEMRVTQAMILANIEMIARAQGLRPIDRDSVAPRNR